MRCGAKAAGRPSAPPPSFRISQGRFESAQGCLVIIDSPLVDVCPIVDWHCVRSIGLGSWAPLLPEGIMGGNVQ